MRLQAGVVGEVLAGECLRTPQRALQPPAPGPEFDGHVLEDPVVEVHAPDGEGDRRCMARQRGERHRGRQRGIDGAVPHADLASGERPEGTVTAQLQAHIRVGNLAGPQQWQLEHLRRPEQPRHRQLGRRDGRSLVVAATATGQQQGHADQHHPSKPASCHEHPIVTKVLKCESNHE
ncbi:hypothetical protein HK414_24730 [Ramlibacter terrae]|uniref:Uncharacterized protein n=1 Tax=Ramlibacter terrae TaxID=2732511 RepID=A0ABX6P5H8_9BURK|nr:hypothetical protein HK414_24730 [Ramlibacter terrae]